jgi:hypothetical protein
MNIWEQPDQVRIAAAQQRVTELLAHCPSARNRQRHRGDELIDGIVPAWPSGEATALNRRAECGF